jgi:NAD(P)-dependent dehydrogenase (short-subunit alcohol dehydrogenase family)
VATGDLADRVVLITGATDGLGRGVAVACARAGATVLAHGRDPERLAATVDELAGIAGPDRVRSYRADLASLDEVRALARAVGEHEPALHVLVSNAGIGTDVPPGGRQESADGIELRFAVNYLAGYLLVEELLDLLRASAPARIVEVSSAGQMPIDFGDVMLERDYSGVRAYCQSKLAQILHVMDLAERLDGSGVTATTLHPATYMPTKIVPSPVGSLQEGVAATMRLVADPALEGVSGRFFHGEADARADAQAYDPEARRQLAELSARLTGRTA